MIEKMCSQTRFLQHQRKSFCRSTQIQGLFSSVFFFVRFLETLTLSNAESDEMVLRVRLTGSYNCTGPEVPFITHSATSSCQGNRFNWEPCDWVDPTPNQESGICYAMCKCTNESGICEKLVRVTADHGSSSSWGLCSINLV